MRTITLLLSVLLFMACGGNEVEKPKRLLSEKEMEDVIYDITMLQAIKSSRPEVLDYNTIKPKEYIFKKYKIDSLTFAQNNTWYAADMETYEKIHKKVTERLKADRDKYSQKNDTMSKTVKPGASKLHAKRDSLKRAALDKQGVQKK